MCCAWIARLLLQAGFTAENEETLTIANRWNGAAADACLASHSADYLIRSDQMDDLEFVLNHVNDLDAVYQLFDQEVLPVEMETLANVAA